MVISKAGRPASILPANATSTTFHSKRRRWESNPLRSGCSRLPCRLAPASVIKCSRQESNLVFDLRKVACESGTLRERLIQYPAEESNLARLLRRQPCILHTRRANMAIGRWLFTLGQQPNAYPQHEREGSYRDLTSLLPHRSAVGPCFRPDGFHQAAVAGIEPACVSLTGSCLTVGPHRNVVESARSDLNRRSRAPEARALENGEQGPSFPTRGNSDCSAVEGGRRAPSGDQSRHPQSDA